MKRLTALVILLAAVSCQKYDLGEILLPREDISLTINGAEEFSYNPLTCQISHDREANLYRVFDDKLSEWFIVECDVMPANEGQGLNASLTWTTGKGTKTLDNLAFTVEKTRPDGRIWMWCRKKNIGIVIKNL